MDYPLSDDEIEARVMDFLREHGPATTEEIYAAVWHRDNDVEGAPWTSRG